MGAERPHSLRMARYVFYEECSRSLMLFNENRWVATKKTRKE
ncbi:MAG: hypothetical protein QXX94_02565 [Candidatus Bathyarchaeia archaeon]